MQALRAELSRMIESGVPLNSEAVLEKSREFDALVVEYYRRRCAKARKIIERAGEKSPKHRT